MSGLQAFQPTEPLPTLLAVRSQPSSEFNPNPAELCRGPPRLHALSDLDQTASSWVTRTPPPLVGVRPSCLQLRLPNLLTRKPA